MIRSRVLGNGISRVALFMTSYIEKLVEEQHHTPFSIPRRLASDRYVSFPLFSVAFLSSPLIRPFTLLLFLLLSQPHHNLITSHQPHRPHHISSHLPHHIHLSDLFKPTLSLYISARSYEVHTYHTKYIHTYHTKQKNAFVSITVRGSPIPRQKKKERSNEALVVLYFLKLFRLLS